MTRSKLLEAYADPKLSARLARVSYVHDDSPGWTRLRHGRSFVYVGEKSKALTSPAVLERLDALRIPPAWKEVWIAPSPRAHVQATGVDRVGRKQYIYHARWTAFRERMKFFRLAAFAQSLPLLRRRIAKALREEEFTKSKVAALALSLIDELAIRVGSDVYARENKTFGVTTLQNRHVVIDDDRITLSFIGKSHQEHELELTDTRLAELLLEEQGIPGTRLLQYFDAGGARHPLTASDVNAFIQEATGGDFTAKDFRTWIGTVHAYERMRKECSRNVSREWTSKEYAKSLRGIIKDVAEKLGNTVAVTKAHYVHAELQKQYACGAFRRAARYLRRVKRVPGLSTAESEILYILQKFEKSTL